MAFGRLERTKGSEPMSDINVTPLVDVMLVLVVIFIITAPLLASSIRLDLPKTDAAKPGEPPKFVTLVVNQGGQLPSSTTARSRRASWPPRCGWRPRTTPRPRCSCAPTRACPTAAWSRSWARHRKPA
jgi:hypothetical protein